MKKFSDYKWLYIDIANQYGLGKENWDVRIKWTQDHLDKLEWHKRKAKKPYLYEKAVNALRDAQRGAEITHCMGLDSTSSGLQLMAALSGCYKTGVATNCIGEDRMDPYSTIAELLDMTGPTEYTKCKKSLMTYFYNSTANPRKLLEDKYDEFLAYLNEAYPGPVAIKQYLNQIATHEMEWEMPDGTIASFIDMETEQTTIASSNYPEWSNISFYRAVKKTDDRCISFAANYIQSWDAYIARETIRRMNAIGKEVYVVHDDFFTQLYNVNALRQVYKEILQEINEGNYIQKLSGIPFRFYASMKITGEYMLS